MNYLLRFTVVAATIVTCFGTPSLVLGQKDAVAQGDPIEELAAEREKALIQSIYERTQSAKTASDFTDLIEACHDGMKKKISDKNMAYLKKLEAWSLERRGHCRCDLGKMMRKASSFEQAKEIFAKATADFEQARELNPKSWKTTLGIGIVHTFQGDYLTAIDSFTELCESHPKQTAGWFNRAELYYQLERYEKAIADYDQVLEIEPADLQAITGRAHCKFKSGNFDEALKDYEVVSTMLANNDAALINLADTHQMLGNWKAAYDSYFAAMSIKTTESGARKAAWLMATCPDQEYFRPELALQLAQKAIELGGETRHNLDTLAAAQAATGDFDAAKKTQELAMASTATVAQDQQDRMAKYESLERYIQTPGSEIQKNNGISNPLQPKR